MTTTIEVKTVEFPPRSWKCPSCGKEHSKPRFPFSDQLDLTKKAGETGRILFNRVGKDDRLKIDTPIKEKFKDKQGSMYNKDGSLNSLFCPHCGFTVDGVVLAKKKPKKAKPTPVEIKVYPDRSQEEVRKIMSRGEVRKRNKVPKNTKVKIIPKKKKSFLSRVKKGLKL